MDMGKAESESIAKPIGCLARLCQEGRLLEAVQAVEVSEREGLRISRNDLFCLLQGCIRQKDLAAAREVNSLIARRGFDINKFFGSHLIRMFASCGSLSEADILFRKLSNPSVYTWHAIIAAHTKLGQNERAFQLYNNLLDSKLKPNEYIHVAVLKACANLTDIIQGNLIYSYIVEDGLETDLYIGNTMMDTYSKCGHLQDAQKVFTKMSNRDVVSWNTLITGYATHVHGLEAIQLLQQMHQEGMRPDDVAYSSVVKACSSMSDARKGELIHHSIIESGGGGDSHFCNILIHMYMECGSVEDANKVFERLLDRDVVTWSTMISGYAHLGHGAKALEAFERMQGENLKPNNVTYPSVLNACASLLVLDEGKLIHFHIMQSDYDQDFYIGSALIDMYAKCGALQDALGVFDRFPAPNEITWNSMIAAYAQTEHGEEALELFQRLQVLGFKPDRVTYLSALKACCSMAALDWGKLLHDQIIRRGFVTELSVGNALIDMYSKCGSLADACTVFGDMPNQGIITWSTLLAAYAQHNDYLSVFECFEKMQKIGVRPNSVTFVSLLSACSQKGFTDKGYEYFFSMKASYGLKPTTEHYNCLIDLLGRGGRMHEAEHLLATMPFQDKFMGWKSLLSHCKVYNQVKRARRCFNRLVVIDPKDASVYALMLDIYANANMWNEVREIQEMRNRAGVRGKLGKASIQVGNVFHSFTVGWRNHPKQDVIYKKLKTVGLQMEDKVSSRKLFNLVSSIFEEHKDDLLCGHCELLAIGLGLTSTKEGTTLRISKNLRVCMDCHAATKFISEVEKREIMIMDTFRVHLFRNGECSCND
ncbi:hypothetical protein GOP47_0018180 [Adiantum capillus-veneris]|uniref:DYW domain-containing protein n=1 Tax=Adiantum capillus-veneris TaxID=13818 RepID=A0A9D4UHA3_ADICA|nr:hypothetical protein GOP47_0018180 [Adiantum capillus-veneris]